MPVTITIDNNGAVIMITMTDDNQVIVENISGRVRTDGSLVEQIKPNGKIVCPHCYGKGHYGTHEGHDYVKCQMCSGTGLVVADKVEEQSSSFSSEFSADVVKVQDKEVNNDTRS